LIGARRRCIDGLDRTDRMTLNAPSAFALPARPIAKETLQDQVFRQMSDLILNGEIAPGQTVTIQAMADAFGVSAMPVREALHRLTAAKALTVVSGRSIGIPPLTAGRLLDLKRVRVEVEGLAGAWAAGRATATAVAELETALDTLSEAARAGDVRSYLRANRLLHFTIYRAAGSDVLIAIIESLWLQISPFFHLLHASGNYVASNREHRQMLRALRQGDADRLRASVVADIEAATKVLLAQL
jgi:DNA-binding GntR family transcriptional regulator